MDALITNRPFFGRITKSGDAVDIGNWNKAADGALTTIYRAKRTWAEQNSQLVSAFRAALDDAAKAILIRQA